MQKVAILAHNSLKEDLIAALHDQGVLEVTVSSDTKEFDHTEVDFRSAELNFATTTLKENASKETLAASLKKTSLEDILHATNHTDVRGIVNALHKLEQSDTDAKRNLQEQSAMQKLLSPWKNFSSQVASSATDTTTRLLGTMPEIHEEQLMNICDRCTIEKISEEKGMGFYAAFVWNEDATIFEEKVTELGWSSIILPEEEGTASQLHEETIAEQKRLAELLQKNSAERRKLSVELPNLLKVETFMQWLDEKQGVRETMANTETTVTILGWMPAKEMEKLSHTLQELSPATLLLKVKPEEGEEPPVLLKNSLMITPFESVTNLYGLPLPTEMDPTRALSPFFILYFALCLTDAGYGAVIAIIFGTVLWKTKKSIEEAKLIWLLFIGGIVTFFVSILFGGWFGFTPEQVPGFLTKETAEGLMFRGQIWNLSLNSGITFLQNLALVLGITHLFFGMFLAGQFKWVHGKKKEAFWVDFTAHILLGSVLFFAFAPAEMKGTATYILYGSLATLIWGKGYGTIWYLRPLMGLLGLLNFAINIISNGLSYLRIMALGLVTGALAAAVNQVAVEMGKLFPIWIGIPVVITIFLLGHLVSIALNTLGSFIHSGRLQFIEFFSQFFEGGGKGFTPFKRSIT